MTIIAVNQAEFVQTTTAITFVEILSKTFTLERDGNNYRLLLSAEFTVNNKNDKAFLQITLDSVEIDIDCYKPDVANDPHKFATMILAQLDSGLHTLSINAKSTSGNTVSVRRVRLSVDKF